MIMCNEDDKLIEEFLKKVTPKGTVDTENHLTILDETEPDDADFWDNLYKETHKINKGDCC